MAGDGRPILVHAWFAPSCHVLQCRGGRKSSAGRQGARAITALLDIGLDDRDTEGAGTDLSRYRRPNLVHGETVRRQPRHASDCRQQPVAISLVRGVQHRAAFHRGQLAHEIRKLVDRAVTRPRSLVRDDLSLVDAQATA